MRIRVLFFASARDVAGVGQAEVQLDEGSRRTVPLGELVQALVQRFPKLAPLLPTCRFALNQEYAGLDASLKEDDEVAVIPPVSGG